MTAAVRLFSVEDLETFPEDGRRYEVLEGELTAGALVIVGQTGGEAKPAGPSGSPLTGGAGGGGGNRGPSGGGGGGGRRGGF